MELLLCFIVYSIIQILIIYYMYSINKKDTFYEEMEQWRIEKKKNDLVK